MKDLARKLTHKMDAQTARLRVNWAELTVAAVGAPAVMVAVGWMAKACGAVMRDGGVKAAAKMVVGGGGGSDGNGGEGGGIRGGG